MNPARVVAAGRDGGGWGPFGHFVMQQSRIASSTIIIFSYSFVHCQLVLVYICFAKEGGHRFQICILRNIFLGGRDTVVGRSYVWLFFLFVSRSPSLPQFIFWVMVW